MRGRRRERKHPEASDQNRGTRTASLEREKRKLYGHRERGASLQVGWGWWSEDLQKGFHSIIQCFLDSWTMPGQAVGAGVVQGTYHRSVLCPKLFEEPGCHLP